MREGKLRRSRPVLPSASEIDVYNSWLPLSLGVGTQGDDGSIVLRGGVDSTLPLGCTIINRSGSHLTTSGRDTKKSDRSASVVRNSSNSIVRSKLGTDGLGQVDGRTRSTGNPTNAAITHSLAGCLAEGAKFKERKKKQEKGGEVHLAAAGSEGLRGEMSAALAAENLGAKDDERGGIRPTVGAGSLPPLTQSQAVAPTREPRMTGVHSVEQAQHGGTVEAIKKKDRGTSSRKGHFRQALAAASALLDSFSTRNNRNRGATGSLASAQSANSLQPSEPLVQSATRSAGATARGAQASLTSQSIPSSMQAARERERLWEGGVTAVPRKLVQREDAARMAPLPAGHRGTDRRVAECRTAAQNFVNVQACTPSPIKGQVPGEQEEAHPRKSLEPCGRRENAYARQGKVTAPLTRSIPVASTTSRVAVPQSGEDSRVTLRLRRAVQQLALSSARSGRDIAKGAYNPGPTFHMSETCTGSRRRGRKKKVVLNASLVTAQDTVDEGKVLALVADPEIHQVRRQHAKSGSTESTLDMLQ